MSEHWFILKEHGREVGPHTPSELMAMGRLGLLNGGSLIRHEDSRESAVAGSVEWLAESFTGGESRGPTSVDAQSIRSQSDELRRPNTKADLLGDFIQSAPGFNAEDAAPAMRIIESGCQQQNPEALFWAGWKSAVSGQHREAQKLLKRARKRGSQDARALLLLYKLFGESLERLTVYDPTELGIIDSQFDGAEASRLLKLADGGSAFAKMMLSKMYRFDCRIGYDQDSADHYRREAIDILPQVEEALETLVPDHLFKDQSEQGGGVSTAMMSWLMVVVVIVIVAWLAHAKYGRRGQVPVPLQRPAAPVQPPINGALPLNNFEGQGVYLGEDGTLRVR